MRLTAVVGPSKTASTRPSSRLRTQPSTPALRACSWAEARKLTPWTRPSIVTRARTRSITVLLSTTNHGPGAWMPHAPGLAPSCDEPGEMLDLRNKRFAPYYSRARHARQAVVSIGLGR